MLTSACKSRIDGSNAAYLDRRLIAVEDSLAKRGYHSSAEQAFLDSIQPGATGVGINQLAHKYIIATTAAKTTQSRISFADSAITLLEHRFTSSENAALLYSRATSLKASEFLVIRSYDEAIRNYTLQKIALNEVKDSCEHIEYYENMARLHFAQGKYKNAAPFYKMVAHLIAKCRPQHSFSGIQGNMSSMALCYQMAGMYDSADYYYNAALGYIDSNKSVYESNPDLAKAVPMMKAIIYGNQGDLSVLQKEYAKAEHYFLKSLEVTRETEKEYTKNTNISWLRVLLNSNQLDKATPLVKELEADSTNNLIAYNNVHLYRALSKYYKLMGNDSLSVRRLEKGFEVRDTLTKRDRQFSSIDVAREFESKEQKNINDALTKDYKLQQSYLLIFIISTLLACIIAGLVWYNLKRKSMYVTRLKKLNDEVEAKNLDLYHTLHSLEDSHTENTRLMRTVAHDLRNPVGAIKILAYSLNRKEQDAEVRDALELIQTTCTDSLNLIKDLMVHRQDEKEISKELVDMGRLIEHCSQVLQLKAEEKSQYLTLGLDHVEIPANREKLYRVISNLVNNAIKFSPNNSEIRIGLEKKEDSVLVTVKDNGIGIPPELKDKILNMSPEGSRKGTAGEESYGLGLAICKKIMLEHNGALWFESEEGKGSVFFMQLPLTRKAERV